MKDIDYLLIDLFIITQNMRCENLDTEGPMVLILDGNSEIGAHVRYKLSYFFCLRRFIRLKAVKSCFFLLRKTHIPSCVRNNSKLPSNVNTMEGTAFIFNSGEFDSLSLYER